jgi:adenylate kinase
MIQDKPYTFVFFGIAGSGKGTQVEMLEQYLKTNSLIYHTVHISPGSEYRKIVSNGSYTGEIIKTTLEAGHLQPDFITNGLFISTLASNLQKNSCIISDGFPRSISQSEAFEEAMDYYERNDIKIFYIEVSKEEAVKRMKLRARNDDTDQSIEKRFDEYVKNVLPSMDYFKNKSGYTIYKINGEQPVPDVHSDIIKCLGF